MYLSRYVDDNLTKNTKRLNKDKCDEIKINVEAKQSNDCPPICKQGEQGKRGPEGPMGKRGKKGIKGSRGPKGNKGYQGFQGNQGFQGFNGIQGIQGEKGVQGFQGLGNIWYINNDCITPNIPEQRAPIEGDKLLNTSTCGICIYHNNEWIATDENLNCIKSEDIYNSIQILPKIDKNSGTCTAILTLTNVSDVFLTMNNITNLVLVNETYTYPTTSFSNPIELGDILNMIEWEYTNVGQTWIYTFDFYLEGTFENTQSYISFANGQTILLEVNCNCLDEFDECLPCDVASSQSKILAMKDDKLYWTEAECLPLKGNQGETGPQGFQGETGPQGETGFQGNQGITGTTTCENIYKCISDIPDGSNTICEYYGINDCSECVQTVIIPGSIALAMNTSDNIIAGPIEYTTNAEYQDALSSLQISINENIYKVNSKYLNNSINRIFYYDNTGNIYITINLYPIKCCEKNENNYVLTKENNTFKWVPSYCLANCDINISKEICSLPLLSDNKCYVQFNTSIPFLNKNPFPWYINTIKIFNEDLTLQYNAKEINNLIDLQEILENNNWEPIALGTPIYRYYKYFDNNTTIITDSAISMIDGNNIIFYVRDTNSDIKTKDFEVCCTNINDDSYNVVFKTGNGVGLAPATKFLDTFKVCSDISYKCTTILPADCFFSMLNINGPWKFKEIILNNKSQTVSNKTFENVEQLSKILIEMGWTQENPELAVYTITQEVDSNNYKSYAIIENKTLESQTINLTVSCMTDCGNSNKYVLTKDDDGEYCWQPPECLRTGPLTILSCCTGCLGTQLENVPDCITEPLYNIRIIIYKCELDVISDYYINSGFNDGPYWISSYTLSNNENIFIGKPIEIFNLYGISKALSELNPPWTTINEITETTDKITLIIYNTSYLIKSININLINEKGISMPFNKSLTINAVLGQECIGLDDETDSILIKKEQKDKPTEYCFMNIECIKPIIPPPINIEYELKSLPRCLEDINYEVQIKINQCDVDLLIDLYGVGNSLEILSYTLEDDIEYKINQLIGTNPTIDDIQSAFTLVGWVLKDDILYYSSKLNIKYVNIFIVGASTSIPPFPYKINVIETTILNCPSQNPSNYILIKKSNGDVCWTKVCPTIGPEGPQGQQGPLGVEGYEGYQGYQGNQGAQGFQGHQGYKGYQGFQGNQGFMGNISNFDCQNIGTGVGLFKDQSGGAFNFKSLTNGDNIIITPSINDIIISVDTNFDWGNTEFSGSANVLSSSSLTFNAGAILKTNNIEETTIGNGITLDTSNGIGVNIKDGGIKFENNVNINNITPRQNYLEYFEYGSFDIEWSINNNLSSFDTTTIKYQRIGNSITIFIPKFGNIVSGFGLSPVQTNTSIQTNLIPNEIQSFNYVYLDGIMAVQTRITIDNTGIIKIYLNYDTDNFGITDTFDGTTMGFTYVYIVL